MVQGYWLTSVVRAAAILLSAPQTSDPTDQAADVAKRCYKRAELDLPPSHLNPPFSPPSKSILSHIWKEIRPKVGSEKSS